MSALSRRPFVRWNSENTDSSNSRSFNVKFEKNSRRRRRTKRGKKLYIFLPRNKIDEERERDGTIKVSVG